MDTSTKRFFEKPVKVNEVYDLEIQEVGRQGDGVARVKGFVVFVKNTKKGDKVKAKIVKVAGRFAIAEVITE
ncbi:MAG: TRAM domain-containing protein [Thermoproteota archaeon]|nr:TRAM domain-containing protein [Thermoproteota archaeon]